MPLPRLVATDLDGTLLRKGGTLSQRTVEALRAAVRAGAEVVVVTARPPRYLDMLGDAAELIEWAVCSNGAMLYHLPRRTVARTWELPVAVARAVAAVLADTFTGVGFAVETGHRVLCEPGFTRGFPADPALQRLASPHLLWEQPEPIVKLLAWQDGGDAAQMATLARAALAVVDGHVEVTHSGGAGLLEISASGVTKAEGLAALCAVRGVLPEQVVAFGDMPNDLPMLAFAGQAYAVANAHPTVLAAVSGQTASNNDDGVALVLERLFAV